MRKFYTDEGKLTAGSILMIQDTDGKYMNLVPIVDSPATKSAPATVDKTVLSDPTVTQVEGLQTPEQKQFTFNYHRDNIRQLNKFVGEPHNFLERNADDTGERYTGTILYARNGQSVNGIQQGVIYLTVSDTDDLPIDDVRDIIKPTACIKNSLPSVKLIGTGTKIINLELTPKATVKATTESKEVATATIQEGKLTITGVAKGNTFIDLEVSATGEATSYRTIEVEVFANGDIIDE